MRKYLFGVLLLGVLGMAYGASQPIASGPSVLTGAVIATIAPNYSGQLVVCSDCGAVNGGKGTICHSTGTARGAWIISGSSLTATTACKN